jgi:hypothetical protein
MMTRTRYTRAIEVGAFEEKIGFTLTFDDQREHFLFERSVARELALKLLQALDQTMDRTPQPPRALGISVAEDISAEERLG